MRMSKTLNYCRLLIHSDDRLLAVKVITIRFVNGKIK